MKDQRGQHLDPTTTAPVRRWARRAKRPPHSIRDDHRWTGHQRDRCGTRSRRPAQAPLAAKIRTGLARLVVVPSPADRAGSSPTTTTCFEPHDHNVPFVPIASMYPAARGHPIEQRRYAGTRADMVDRDTQAEVV